MILKINGIEYLLYSVEGHALGGLSKKEAIRQLKEAGIKVVVNSKHCHTPYAGHYALLVEASREADADKILF